jgi:cytochrome c-type biogenesis protein CcmH
MTARLAAAVLFLLSIVSQPMAALHPDEMLEDPALEARARALSEGLRCLVCQNQSIDDSDAPLARDLRLLVRERLEAGDSDEEILDFVVARYGKFVLLKPPLDAQTLLLWGATPVLLLIGLGVVVLALRRRRLSSSEAAAPLSQAERRRLDRLLGNE